MQPFLFLEDFYGGGLGLALLVRFHLGLFHTPGAAGSFPLKYLL